MRQALYGDLCPVLGTGIQTGKNMQVSLFFLDLLNNAGDVGSYGKDHQAPHVSS